MGEPFERFFGGDGSAKQLETVRDHFGGPKSPNETHGLATQSSTETHGENRVLQTEN